MSTTGYFRRSLLYSPVKLLGKVFLLGEKCASMFMLLYEFTPTLCWP